MSLPQDNVRHLSLLALSFTLQVYVLLHTAPRYVSHKRGRAWEGQHIIFGDDNGCDGWAHHSVCNKRGRLSSSCKSDKQVLRKKKGPEHAVDFVLLTEPSRFVCNGMILLGRSTECPYTTIVRPRHESANMDSRTIYIQYCTCPRTSK